MSGDIFYAAFVRKENGKYNTEHEWMYFSNTVFFKKNKEQNKKVGSEIIVVKREDAIGSGVFSEPIDWLSQATGTSDGVLWTTNTVASEYMIPKCKLGYTAIGFINTRLFTGEKREGIQKNALNCIHKKYMADAGRLTYYNVSTENKLFYGCSSDHKTCLAMPEVYKYSGDDIKSNYFSFDPLSNVNFPPTIYVHLEDKNREQA